MRSSLDLPEATIQIVELSRFPAPPGPLNFRPSSLHKPPSGRPDTPVMWRGWIDIGKNRRFSIWARVRIKMPLSRVVAAEAIQAGQPIRAEQLKIETYEGFPLSRPDVTDVELVVGRISRRSFAAGTPISRALLRMPREVDRGDLIQVVARVGGAVIKGEGQAESGGKRGDTIRVRNPSSGLTFRATVVGPGTVSVAESGI
jgi:flagella basal body P-ring formation protein FlgA